MVFTKYEKTKYIFIFLSLFICLYFSCTVTLVPDCAVFFVILIEIISFLWIQFYLISFLYIQFFAFQTYFGLFYRVSFSAIFRWRTNQSRGIISFLRMWSFLGWNLTVIFVSYVGICGTLPDEKPRGHVITVVQIGKLILIVRVREFLANGTFTRQVIDVWE